MNNNDGKKLEELFKDQDFAKKVLLDETPENARELLKEKGVDVSAEEMGQIRDFIEKVKNGEISEEQLKKMQDGELEPEDMKQIAGGCPLILAFLPGIIFGGGFIGGIAYLDNKYHSNKPFVIF